MPIHGIHNSAYGTESGTPGLKDYLIVNVGCSESPRMKTLHLLLFNTANMAVRTVSVPTHSEQPNWTKLRSLLGDNNPPASKQMDAMLKLRDLFMHFGGIKLSERRANREPNQRPRSKSIFIDVIPYEPSFHPGVAHFSISKVNTGRIKSILPFIPFNYTHESLIVAFKTKTCCTEPFPVNNSEEVSTSVEHTYVEQSDDLEDL